MDDSRLNLASELTVATRSWGSPGELPVLAVHGWLDNAASFDRLAPFLDGLHLVAVDLPGHGQSEWRSRDAEYHYVDWVAILWDIARALQWQEFSLLGHSMGAGISGLFAGLFPDRVRRLVMLEGLGPYTTRPADAVDNLRRAVEARPRHLERTPRRMENIQAAVARKVAALPYLEGVARGLVERGTRPADGGVAFSHDPRLQARSLLRFTEEHVLEIFDRITSPTLVVQAIDGLKYPEGCGDGDARLARISDAQVLAVEGNHHVHLTHPERVATPIRDFLVVQE